MKALFTHACIVLLLAVLVAGGSASATDSIAHNQSASARTPKRLGQDELRRKLSDLLRQLESKDPRARWEAVDAIGGLGSQAESAIPRLVRCLDDPEYLVRFRAADALGRIGSSRFGADRALLRSLRRDPEAKVRLSAASALKDLRSIVVADSLVHGLSDPDAHVRAATARALWETGYHSEHIVDHLVAALRDPEPGVGWNASWALQVIGSPRARAAFDLYRDTSRAAEKARAARASLPRLILASHHEDTLVRSNAIDSIGAFGRTATDAAPRLLDLVLHEQNKGVFLSAARALGSVGGPASTELLIRAAKSPDVAQRTRAVNTIAWLKSDSDVTVRALLEACSDPDKSVRFVASTGIEWIRPLSARHAPRIIDALRSSTDELVHSHLGSALSHVGAPSGVFLEMLGDSAKHVRWAAAWALGNSGDTTRTVVQALAASLRGGNHEAVGALQELGSTVALESLRVIRGLPDAYGPAEENLRIVSAVGRPDTRAIAVAVVSERFRPSTVADGSIGRLYERQEVWLYRCDVDTRTVRKLAVLRAPSTARHEFEAGIGGWEGDDVVVTLAGCREWLAWKCLKGSPLRAHYRVSSNGKVQSIPWIPGTARRPTNNGVPTWNEENFMRVSWGGSEVRVFTEPGVRSRPVFRLDVDSKTIVQVD